MRITSTNKNTGETGEIDWITETEGIYERTLHNGTKQIFKLTECERIYVGNYVSTIQHLTLSGQSLNVRSF